MPLSRAADAAECDHWLVASAAQRPARRSAIARAVETIDRNAKSQAQLIEDILDTSRIITGKLRLNQEPVDISSVINAAIDSVQLAVDSKNLQLGVTLDPSARQPSATPAVCSRSFGICWLTRSSSHLPADASK